MDSQQSLDYIIENDEFVKRFATALATDNGAIKKQVFEILSALCVYSKDGYARALEVLDFYKTSKGKKYRFSCILDEIRSGENVPYKTNLLEFINCLIIYAEGVDQRIRIRNEFYGLRLKEILNALRKSDDDNVQMQLQLFDEHERNDEDGLPGTQGIDLGNPLDVFQAILRQVGDTPHELSFLTVLQHLLKIDPANEELSETVWQAVEQLVSKATVLESPEDAQKLITSVRRRLDSGAGAITSPPSVILLGRSRRGSNADILDGAGANNKVSQEAPERSGDSTQNVSSEPAAPPPLPPPPPPLPPHGFFANISNSGEANQPDSSAMMSGPSAPPPPPPPPPAMPGVGPPPPPPLPPPGGRTTSGAPAADLPQTNIPRPRGKMKTLQWQKIPITSVIGKANLWTMVGRMSQKYEMDYEKMDELFSANVESGAKRPGQVNETNLDGKKRKENAEINILDGKRSLNVNIFLKQFRMEHAQIVQILRDGRSDLFGPERLRGFLKLLPSQEEIDALNAFEGDREKLGNAEKFFLTLMTLPNYRMRIEGLLIKEEFNVNIEWIRPSIEAVLQAAKDIQENTSLRELIFLILISGNYLNSGNYAGNAAGFKLSSLLKLTELRANKPRMNLMHYVAQEAEEKNPKLLHFPEEMKFLKDASSVSVEGLSSDITSIANKVRAITEQIVVTGKDFQMQMAEFLQAANVEVVDLEEDLKDIEAMRKDLATFFCEDHTAFKLEECFKVLQTFCDRMRKAIEENNHRKLLESKAEQKRKSAEVELRKSSTDIQEPTNQSMDRSLSTSGEDDEGSIVDMLLADVRSGFASRKFNDGTFSVTKVTKVNLNPADLVNAITAGTGDVIGNSTNGEDGSGASFVRGGYSRSSQRRKRQDGSSVDGTSDGRSSPGPDSLSTRRNRRSYATEDNASLIDFLMDAEDQNTSDPQKPEANFERYASLRRRRQERKEKRHSGHDLIDHERERAPSPSISDSRTSAGKFDPAPAVGQIRNRGSDQLLTPAGRPKSQDQKDEAAARGGRTLRRTRSWLDRPSVEKANQDLAEKDSSDALISRIKQRLGRRDGGATTPPIMEESGTTTTRRSDLTAASTDLSSPSSTRWRSGIPVDGDVAAGSPLDTITETSPSLEDFVPTSQSKAIEKTRERTSNRFRSSLDPAEVSKALQEQEATDNVVRSKDDSDVSSPSVMVSVRKQISSGMGTNIDHILKTIEDTGRQIDTVGVSGPIKRSQSSPCSNKPAPQGQVPVAVVAHVTAQNRPITPIGEVELKKKRDKRKQRSTLSMDDVKAAMKLDLSTPQSPAIETDSSDINNDSVNNISTNSVSTSKTPPTPRRLSGDMSDDSASVKDEIQNKEISKAAKLAAKKKFRDARFGGNANSESSNGNRPKSNVEANSVDQALKEFTNKGNMSRSKSYDEHVAKKAMDGNAEDFESNGMMRNSGSAPDTSKEKKAVMRKSTSRLSMDGRRNGLYIPSDESDTELKPEHLGTRRSSKSDSPKSFSRLSLKSTNTSTETLQNDVDSSPEQRRKSSTSSTASQNTPQQKRKNLASRDDTYANTSVNKSSHLRNPPNLLERPTSACAMDAYSSPLRRTYSLMDRSKAFDEESDNPLATMAKWRLKRESKRMSVYDNVYENETADSTTASQNETPQTVAPQQQNQQNLKSETTDLKNEVGSRSSYASSYASSNERDEGFESASGTLSQRTSMSSTLEAEFCGTPTLSRRAENMKVKNSVESPLIRDKTNSVDIAQRLSEEVDRKERTENWTEQTVRVSTVQGVVTKDPSSDTSNEFSALSPDSGHSTSKEDIWSDDAASCAEISEKNAPPLKQKSNAATARKNSTGKAGDKPPASPTKSLPSYMRPTSSSSVARDSPSRTLVKERELPPTLKRDSGVRASMRAETGAASFTRGTVSRTSMRGPRSAAQMSAARSSAPVSGAATTIPTSPTNLRPPASRTRADSNVSVSSTTSTASNASGSVAASSKRRLSHTSSTPAGSLHRPTTPSSNLRPTTPSSNHRPVTPSARPTTPAATTARSTTPAPSNKGTALNRSPAIANSSSTKPPPARSSAMSPPPGSGPTSSLKRTQSMRVSSSRPSVTAETASSAARRQAPTPTPDGRRSTTPLSASSDGRRSTTPLSPANSRSTTPLPQERPKSTTPMDGRTTPSRRSSFMAPTAASKAKADEQTPVAPHRTRSLTTKADGSLTRHASLRLPKKSVTSTLTSQELTGNGRKSPATPESPLYQKEHHQSLSTVTEQTADEEKESEASKKSPSLLKRIGLSKTKVSPGSGSNSARSSTTMIVSTKKK